MHNIQDNNKEENYVLEDGKTPSSSSSSEYIKYAIMYGYNVDDIDDTGFLLVRHDNNGEFGSYDVINDIDKATWFDYSKTNPQKWLDFFNSEEELQSWRFHIVTRKWPKK